MLLKLLLLLRVVLDTTQLKRRPRGARDQTTSNVTANNKVVATSVGCIVNTTATAGSGVVVTAAQVIETTQGRLGVIRDTIGEHRFMRRCIVILCLDHAHDTSWRTSTAASVVLKEQSTQETVVTATSFAIINNFAGVVVVYERTIEAVVVIIIIIINVAGKAKVRDGDVTDVVKIVRDVTQVREGCLKVAMLLCCRLANGKPGGRSSDPVTNL